MVWTICAGKVDFKHKTQKIFRATRDFNNGSLWDDVRTTSHVLRTDAPE